MEEIKKKLKEIIVNELELNVNLDSISDDISLYDDGLGLDSIAIINFIVLIEQKFNIRFDEDEISSKLFSNINSLAEFIRAKSSLNVVN